MDSEESLSWESPQDALSAADQAVRRQAQARPLVLLLVAVVLGFLLGRRNRQ